MTMDHILSFTYDTWGDLTAVSIFLLLTFFLSHVYWQTLIKFFSLLIYTSLYRFCMIGSYAKEWCSLQQELKEAGIGGPIFVTIGDTEKLNQFLDANPFIPKEQAFVDDYSFDAYKAAGFSRFDQVDKDVAKKIGMGSAPELGFGEWINYFTTVGKVSPIPKVSVL